MSQQGDDGGEETGSRGVFDHAAILVIIILRMSDELSSVRRFTLDEANALLPTVKRLTADAVHDTESIAARMRRAGPGSEQYVRLDESLNERITQWASDIEALGVHVKGLWLVDFDNGDGYYCWQHPEPAVSHYHGYDDGFAGRMKIV
jgi:hypothetical protein